MLDHALASVHTPSDLPGLGLYTIPHILSIILSPWFLATHLVVVVWHSLTSVLKKTLLRSRFIWLWSTDPQTDNRTFTGV
jgi:hypothetical protein